MIVTVKTPNGNIQQLSLHPPLRLHIMRSNTPSLSQLSPEVMHRVVSFLEPYSEDWLASDSICQSWRKACLAYVWKDSMETRKRVADVCWARRRISRKWRKLQGFMTRIQLNGPASNKNLQALKMAVHPWRLPSPLLASLQIHDGEQESLLIAHAPCGLYPGARLLSAREMAGIISQWRTKEEQLWLDPKRLTIPLFSEAGSRQVAMELWLDCNNTNQHGRVVLLNAIAPMAAPHFRVLAESWEGFLTLV